MCNDKQEEEDTPKSGSITNPDCMNPDDIQVLSSEVIVIEDGVRDDVAGAEPKLTQPKCLQKFGTAANVGLKQLLHRNSDKTS